MICIQDKIAPLLLTSTTSSVTSDALSADLPLRLPTVLVFGAEEGRASSPSYVSLFTISGAELHSPVVVRGECLLLINSSFILILLLSTDAFPSGAVITSFFFTILGDDEEERELRDGSAFRSEGNSPIEILS